jgi:receptor expression-enhancing protein 5/6
MTDEDKPIIIFVPGLYGSALGPASGGMKRRWNPPTSGIVSLATCKGKGHLDIKLPITWSENEEGVYVQDEDDITAEGCLKVIQNKLLDYLDTLHKNNLIDFFKIVWDWRRSFEETEKTISEDIKSICSSGSRKVILISHGTGSMICWPTINKNPEWFQAWVSTSGVTQYGSTKYLKEFDQGLARLIGKKPLIKVMSEEAYFSFAGLYSYFPVKGEQIEGPGESNLVKADGTYYNLDDIDLHNVSTWEKLSLGIFKWKEEPVTEEEKKHLQHALDAAKRFRKKHFGPDISLEKDIGAYAHLKIICFGNDKFKAHSAFQVNADETAINVSKSEVTSAGDMSVAATTWQTIPGGLEPEVVMAERFSTHFTMVNDRKLRYLLMDIFFEKEDDKKASCAEILKAMDQDRDQTKLIAAIFLIFSFLLGYGGLKVFVDLVGFLYPAYMSLQYNPKVNTDDAIQWMSYWLVYFTMYMTEGLFPALFKQVPYYFSIKMGIYVWLCHPDTHGAKVLYDELITRKKTD